MANQPAKSKRKSTTASPDPALTILKTASSPTLSAAGTIIGYEIATDESGALLIRLASSTGKGWFNKSWINLNSALEALGEFGKKHSIKSLALKNVYPPNTSVNSWAFLMSVLVAEGLVEPADDKRHFILSDRAAFLASIEKLQAAHSQPGKAKPKAEPKAVARMPKGKAKPATGK